jgi:hypothetical protein
MPGVFSALKRSLLAPAGDLSRGGRRWILAVLVAYVLAGTLAMDRWQHRAGQSIRQLGFGYGALITAIEDTGRYRVPAGVHYPGVAFSAHRLPFIPYFLIGLADICGDDLRWVGLAKSAVFGGLLVAALLLVLRRSRLPLGAVLLLAAGALTMPRWLLNVFELGLEEGYNIAVLGLLFALLWFSDPAAERRRAWRIGVGLLLVLLLFLKSSMVYWCLAVPFLVWWRRRDRRAAAILLVAVGLGLGGLAAFNLRVSGRFTIGSSWEGWNLYKGNCAETAALYPPYSLDLLDYEGKVVADRPLADEWDHNAYFRDRAIAFIRAHPGTFLELAARKAWIFYGEVRASGLAQRGESRYRPAYLVQIPWMIGFRLLLWGALVHAAATLVRGSWRSEAGADALTYFVFLALYSGFHLVGFAYERHVMPIVLPTVFYVIRAWGRRGPERVIGATNAKPRA